MRYLSIFSGIEAATVAWEPLRWEPVAFAEVDPFPSAVLAQRWPHVPNLGDVTKVDWKEFVREHGPIDLVVGGSPCQSFSTAAGANRTGLDGPSGLMWEYVRCIRDVMPRWVLWENVVGALSSSKGDDLRCLLESLANLGFGMAFRCLDAQFARVPVWNGDGTIARWVGPVAQRRRRVFLVGYSGSPAPPRRGSL